MRRGEPGAARAMRSALHPLLLLLSLGVISSCSGTPTVVATTATTVSKGLSTKPNTLAPAGTVAPTVIATTPRATTVSTTAAQTSVPATTPQAGSSPTRLSTRTTNTPAGTTASRVTGSPVAATPALAPGTKPPTSAPAHKAPSSTPSKMASPSTGTASKGTVSTGVVVTPSPILKTISAAIPTPGKSPDNTVTTVAPKGGGTTASTKDISTTKVAAPAATPSEKPKTGDTTTRTATTKQLGGTTGSTAAHTAGTVPPPPGSSSGTSTTRRTPSASPQPPAAVPDTSFVAQTEIVCEKTAPPEDQAIILTLNQSTPCSSLEKSPLKEPLLNVLCKAVKATFNRSRDGCTARLASRDDPKYLAVVDVAVRTNSADKELFESLAAKMGELEMIGVKNITHGGRAREPEMEDRFSLPLIITIVCMAASLLLGAAIYGCCHQRIAHRKDQQRLTEELQTMENGYHDNPTLDVMETSSEMQEKKVNLNGELGDSWIVPMDSLTKDDLEDEEDTHL